MAKGRTVPMAIPTLPIIVSLFSFKMAPKNVRTKPNPTIIPKIAFAMIKDPVAIPLINRIRLGTISISKFLTITLNTLSTFSHLVCILSKTDLNLFLRKGS